MHKQKHYSYRFFSTTFLFFISNQEIIYFQMFYFLFFSRSHQRTHTLDLRNRHLYFATTLFSSRLLHRILVVFVSVCVCICVRVIQYIYSLMKYLGKCVLKLMYIYNTIQYMLYRVFMLYYIHVL